VLGTALWLVVALGLLAGVLLDGAAAFGRAGLHAAADHAIEAAMHDAVADYQNRLQTALAHDSLPQGATATRYDDAVRALPDPLGRTYVPTANDGSPAARFTLDYAVSPTTLAAPECPRSAAPDSSGPDAIGWLQCNAFVAESRMSLRVAVRVLDTSGAVLARREQYVTLRLFGEPPYSAVAGRKDASAGDPVSADALAPPAHEGDAAGDTVSGASPAPQPSTWPSGGTLIHVRYECHDGAGSCANAAPPDPDADLRSGTRWANGNAPAP
jgi:hypothetical protein